MGYFFTKCLFIFYKTFCCFDSPLSIQSKEVKSHGANHVPSSNILLQYRNAIADVTVCY